MFGTHLASDCEVGFFIASDFVVCKGTYVNMERRRSGNLILGAVFYAMEYLHYFALGFVVMYFILMGIDRIRGKTKK